MSATTHKPIFWWSSHIHNFVILPFCSPGNSIRPRCLLVLFVLSSVANAGVLGFNIICALEWLGELLKNLENRGICPKLETSHTWRPSSCLGISLSFWTFLDILYSKFDIILQSKFDIICIALIRRARGLEKRTTRWFWRLQERAMEQCLP